MAATTTTIMSNNGRKLRLTADPIPVTSRDHPNTIIHIDIDCFYAQVEEIRDPALRDRPLGIQQKQCLVTCNYKAREFGVKKLMSIAEAQKLCPDLVLVKGEDLTPYRQMSSRIFEVLARHYPHTNIERLGMDENFLDVTNLVANRMDVEEEDLTVRGHIWPAGEGGRLDTNCECGCDKRLIIGSQIAEDLRNLLNKELGITTCAGIGHNKMLAKLAGALNKPNQQTVVNPTKCKELMIHLGELRSIVGIGQKTESLLNELDVTTIGDLQRVDTKNLVLKFGPEMAKKLKDWSFGVDLGAVKASNLKPKSVGLEDSCKPISVRQDIENKFDALLARLLNQVADDSSRVPVALKMTLRKFDSVRKTSHRETKQANVLPTLFRFDKERLVIVDGGQEKLLRIIMRLFDRVVDMRMPFNISLLGLAFSKFQERRSGGSSIASFLIKKQDIEVQSVTNLSSEGLIVTAPFNGRLFFQERDYETMSDTMSVASDISEPSEIEPSPKKSRIGLNFIQAKRRCLQAVDAAMEASPSKLRVADLRLNSIEMDRDVAMSPASTPTTPSSPRLIVPMPCVDPEVFRELPQHVQNELIASWTHHPGSSSSAVSTAVSGGGVGAPTGQAKQKPPPTNTLHRYFIKNK